MHMYVYMYWYAFNGDSYIGGTKKFGIRKVLTPHQVKNSNHIFFSYSDFAF